MKQQKELSQEEIIKLIKVGQLIEEQDKSTVKYVRLSKPKPKHNSRTFFEDTRSDIADDPDYEGIIDEEEADYAEV